MPQRFAAVIHGAPRWSAGSFSPHAQPLATPCRTLSPSSAALSRYTAARLAADAHRRLSRQRWSVQPALPLMTNCKVPSFWGMITKGHVKQFQRQLRSRMVGKEEATAKNIRRGSVLLPELSAIDSSGGRETEDGRAILKPQRIISI